MGAKTASHVEELRRLQSQRVRGHVYRRTLEVESARQATKVLIGIARKE